MPLKGLYALWRQGKRRTINLTYKGYRGFLEDLNCAFVKEKEGMFLHFVYMVQCTEIFEELWKDTSLIALDSPLVLDLLLLLAISSLNSDFLG